MNSACISNCVNDAHDLRVPIRATYINRYRWPESDYEFVKSVQSNSKSRCHHLYGAQQHPRVVDSISCRQMYLRSYKFSREESVQEKTQKCFGKVKGKLGHSHNYGGKRKKRIIRPNDNGSSGRRRSKCFVRRKMEEISCAALLRIFQKFLFCAASVDVLDA